MSATAFTTASGLVLTRYDSTLLSPSTSITSPASIASLAPSAASAVTATAAKSATTTATANASSTTTASASASANVHEAGAAVATQPPSSPQPSPVCPASPRDHLGPLPLAPPQAHAAPWSPRSYLAYPGAQQPGYTPHARYPAAPCTARRHWWNTATAVCSSAHGLAGGAAAQSATNCVDDCECECTDDDNDASADDSSCSSSSSSSTSGAKPAYVSYTDALATVAQLGPLTTPACVAALRSKTAAIALASCPAVSSSSGSQNDSNPSPAATGRRPFLLQAGDCAERFVDAAADPVRRKLRLLRQMALILSLRGGADVTTLGRIAGQYAKPRSNAWETVTAPQDSAGSEQQQSGDASAALPRPVRVPVFRGDSVNGVAPTAEARRHDPRRLVQAHECAMETVRLLNSVDMRSNNTNGGDQAESERMGNLRELLQLCCLGRGCDVCGFPASEPANASSSASTAENGDAAVCGGNASAAYTALLRSQTQLDCPSTDEPVVYTSHEGLVLGYEVACINNVNTSFIVESSVSADSSVLARTGAVCLSADFIWIGERTRALGEAHIELFRGVGNALGIKVGPSARPQELVAALAALDPAREPGRVSVITRLGAARVSASLPALVTAVAAAGHSVVWVCDPMHGNTVATPAGVKTRPFAAVTAELEETAATLAACGAALGGVHLEVTGDDVTECLGGPRAVGVDDLGRCYTSLCDPRLNYEQALAVAFVVADILLKYPLPQSTCASDA